MTNLAQGIVGKAAIYKGVVKPASYVIHIGDRQFAPITDLEFQVSVDNSSQSMTPDGEGILKVVRPGNGKIILSL